VMRRKLRLQKTDHLLRRNADELSLAMVPEAADAGEHEGVGRHEALDRP